MHDHRAAQRDREEHAEAAAAGRHDERLPELEALPVADHEHARDDEDDGRQRALFRLHKKNSLKQKQNFLLSTPRGQNANTIIA